MLQPLINQELHGFGVETSTGKLDSYHSKSYTLQLHYFSIKVLKTKSFKWHAAANIHLF